MGWKTTGEPTVRKQRNKWTVRSLPHRRTHGERGHRRIRRRVALDYLHADLERRRRALDEPAADADAFGFFEA